MILKRAPYDRPPTVEELLAGIECEECNLNGFEAQIRAKVGKPKGERPRTQADLERAEERHYFQWWAVYWLRKAVAKKREREAEEAARKAAERQDLEVV